MIPGEIRDPELPDGVTCQLDSPTSGAQHEAAFADKTFYQLAQEEKNIRKNPAARVTKTLKEVLGTSST